MIYEISRYIFLGGGLLLAIANLSSMRLKSAPPIGSPGPRWPWQQRDRYTKRGYITHLTGWILFLLGGFFGALTFFD